MPSIDPYMDFIGACSFLVDFCPVVGKSVDLEEVIARIVGLLGCVQRRQ
jgi:hypothetical protein